MNTNRNIAAIIGVLFILTEITSITALILYDPILHDPAYMIKAAASETRILWGACFEILLVLTQIGTAIMLFPILKKQHESLAVGTVCFRLMEATLVMIGVISLLAMVTLHHDFTQAVDPSASFYLMAGKILLNIHDWTFLYGPNLMLGPSTFLTSYILYKSNLVPRFIVQLGMVGGPLISLNAVLVTFGVFTQLSAWGFALAVPVFTCEMSLALRLLWKGFNTTHVAEIPVQNLFKLAGRQR